MRGLKTLIGGMSALIILGLMLLAYGIATKTGDKTGNSARLEAQSVILPARSVIKNMASTGDGLVALHVSIGETDYIYLMDPANGAIRKKMVVEKNGKP